MKKVIGILGGGISGLSLASSIIKRSNLYQNSVVPTVVVFEKSNRLGGWIRSVEKDGYLFECGPRSLRSINASNKDLLKMISDLRLEDQIILGDANLAKKRFVYYDRMLHKLPNSLSSIFLNPSSYQAGIPQGILHDIFTSKHPLTADTSIFKMIESRFGSTVAENIIDPVVQGIYGGDARRLSSKACFPNLYQMYQAYRSLTLGMLSNTLTLRSRQISKDYPNRIEDLVKKSPMFSFKKGMESLVKALHQDLVAKGVEVVDGFDCKSIDITSNGITLSSVNLRKESVDLLVSTLPSRELINVCARHHSTSSLKSLVSEINESADIAVVNIGYKMKPTLPAEGFGYLVASKEKSPIMGVVFDSLVFPQQQKEGNFVMTLMLNPNMLPDRSIDSTIDCGMNALKSQWIGIDSSYLQYDSVYASLNKGAIPQYLVGHSEKVQTLEAQLCKLPYKNRLFIHGAFMRHIAISDIISNSDKIATDILSKIVDM